jgi:hypothetical protein
MRFLSVAGRSVKAGISALFFAAQTEGCNGYPVKKADRIFEMTGDFVSTAIG